MGITKLEAQIIEAAIRYTEARETTDRIVRNRGGTHANEFDVLIEAERILLARCKVYERKALQPIESNALMQTQ